MSERDEQFGDGHASFRLMGREMQVVGINVIKSSLVVVVALVVDEIEVHVHGLLGGGLNIVVGTVSAGGQGKQGVGGAEGQGRGRERVSKGGGRGRVFVLLLGFVVSVREHRGLAWEESVRQIQRDRRRNGRDGKGDGGRGLIRRERERRREGED